MLSWEVSCKICHQMFLNFTNLKNGTLLSYKVLENPFHETHSRLHHRGHVIDLRRFPLIAYGQFVTLWLNPLTSFVSSKTIYISFQDFQMVFELCERLSQEWLTVHPGGQSSLTSSLPSFCRTHGRLCGSLDNGPATSPKSNLKSTQWKV